MNTPEKIINVALPTPGRCLTFDQYLQKLWTEDEKRDWNYYLKAEKGGGQIE